MVLTTAGISVLRAAPPARTTLGPGRPGADLDRPPAIPPDEGSLPIGASGTIVEARPGTSTTVLTTVPLPPTTQRLSTAGPEISVEPLTITPAEGGPIAAAFVLRDDYAVTSAQAIGVHSPTDILTIGWGDITTTATLVAVDPSTDIAVIRLDEVPPGELVTAAAVTPGLEVSVRDVDGIDRHREVTHPASVPALADDTPIIGIVELEGTRGDIPAGSPAFDEAGAVVGMTAATAGDRRPR
ncbi:MAG: hypothetical protein R2695_21390 [Acidimicrobiales bacterium]